MDLHYIVSSVKMDIGEDSNAHDLQYLKWAVDIFKRLSIGNALQGAFKTERIPVIIDAETGEKSINMPTGYNGYLKMSICQDGYIVNLDANDNICIAPPRMDCCGQELAEAIESDIQRGENAPYAAGYWWGYFPYFKNGQFVAGIYGVGEGGYRAGFKEDWENRRIVFDRYLRHDEVILEYQTNGILPDGNAIVPPGAEHALVAGVHWKRKFFSKNPIENRDWKAAKSDYQREVKGVIARKMAMTVVEILDIYRNSYTQLPKR